MHLALAIRNRGYTNKVRLRGLIQNQGFQPAQAGFACVAKPLRWAGSPTCSKWRATSSRPGARYQERDERR
ncbi:hypothetical protein I8751_24810 [Nostocaceae cyanobacterium CENA357]|uniref:Uncharacterized protein n=1 Tax=Atlanticothrix silvestris CENA357 TaxID=1725252 RepID=A0A8J7L560_9CYAN|nr:hypothetical protein [Atlanticothrix silvestris CENA357]